MTSFDKLQTMIPEQERINCPFCNSGYVSENEHRPLVTCTICDGYAVLALKAIEEVEAIMDNLHTIPTSIIEFMTRRLGPGWYRSEFRTFWRARRHAECIAKPLNGKKG